MGFRQHQLWSFYRNISPKMYFCTLPTTTINFQKVSFNLVLFIAFADFEVLKSYNAYFWFKL